MCGPWERSHHTQALSRARCRTQMAHVMCAAAQDGLCAPNSVMGEIIFYPGQLCRDPKVLCHDRNFPNPDQLCHDINLLFSDILSLALANPIATQGKPCRDIETRGSVVTQSQEALSRPRKLLSKPKKPGPSQNLLR